MVWYSDLFKNFPVSCNLQSQTFVILNKAEIDVFLELSCFFNDPVDVGMSGATLGITDKMEAWPKPPLLIPQAQSQDEGVRSCDSDLFIPFFS